MPKTLLYEDAFSTAQMVKKVFEAKGYNVLLSEGGLVGIALAEAHRPDVILLDINLPDMDDYAIGRRFRESRSLLTRTPLLALTGSALDGDAQKALQAGCNLYLAKPVSVRELWNRVETLLGEAG